MFHFLYKMRISVRLFKKDIMIFFSIAFLYIFQICYMGLYCWVFFFKILLLFREKRREGERVREKCLTYNPGMCPDWNRTSNL